MGRPKKIETSEETKALDSVVSKDRETKEAKSIAVKEVEKNYGDGKEYDLFRLESEISFYQEQAGTSLLEIGKRLLRIKAHEVHGGFLEALHRVNIESRTARYAMSAARKFSNVQAPAHLGNEKIRALTVLEDDDIKKLEDGGEVFGITLDDIDRMGTRELRDTLRKEREKRKHEKDARENVIKKKEEKINELEEQVRYLPPATKRDIAKAKVDKLHAVFYKELRLLVYHYLRLNKIFSNVEGLDGVDFVIIEDFVKTFDKDFLDLHDAHEQFFADYDNPHVLSSKEKKERGVVIDNFDIEELEDDRMAN